MNLRSYLTRRNVIIASVLVLLFFAYNAYVQGGLVLPGGVPMVTYTCDVTLQNPLFQNVKIESASCGVAAHKCLAPLSFGFSDRGNVKMQVGDRITASTYIISEASRKTIQLSLCAPPGAQKILVSAYDSDSGVIVDQREVGLVGA